MKRLILILIGVAAGLATSGSPAARGQTPAATASSQSPVVRSPSQAEIRLHQALRANPATAPYPFSTEPRGSRILLRGRVGAKIIHDVAVRMAIDLGVPIEDAIVIDTAFNPPGGRGGFGTVPGPGPNLAGGSGFGGPPAFGNYGAVPPGAGGNGIYGAGGGIPPGAGGSGAPMIGGGYGAGSAGLGGGYGGMMSPIAAFPSAGSYGGAPSLLPPPIFGRYDDPFYGFDPPAVIYPPWWGGLNAQRVQSNGGFNGNGMNQGVNQGMNPGLGQNGGGLPSGLAATGPLGTAPGVAFNNFGAGTNPGQGGTNPANPPVNATETDIGPIPDGTIDMEIDGNGIATLRGAVPSLDERLAIGQRVAQAGGVSQVINLLTIKPSMSKVGAGNGNANAGNAPPPPIAADGPAIEPAAVAPVIISTPKAGGAMPRVASKPDATGDSAVTERASRALADRAAVIGSPVQVKVRDGVAQLSGKLGSVFEAMLAYRSVQQTPGVRSVDDRLEFPVPDGTNGSNPLIDKGRPDDVEPYLEAQIRRQVGDIAHIDRVRLQADVLDLRGTLARSEDRDRFDAILRSMPLLRGFQVHTDMPVASP